MAACWEVRQIHQTYLGVSRFWVNSKTSRLMTSNHTKISKVGGEILCFKNTSLFEGKIELFINQAFEVSFWKASQDWKRRSASLQCRSIEIYERFKVTEVSSCICAHVRAPFGNARNCFHFILVFMFTLNTHTFWTADVQGQTRAATLLTLTLWWPVRCARVSGSKHLGYREKWEDKTFKGIYSRTTICVFLAWTQIWGLSAERFCGSLPGSHEQHCNTVWGRKQSCGSEVRRCGPPRPNTWYLRLSLDVVSNGSPSLSKVTHLKMQVTWRGIH